MKHVGIVEAKSLCGILAALLYLQAAPGGPAGTQAINGPSANIAGSLLTERRDLRISFYQDIQGMEQVVSRGCFLIIPDGVIEHVREVSTNECPTVESALRKHAPEGFGDRRQIRVVQQNMVVQTPLPRNTDWSGGRSNVLGLSLRPGDIVIVTRVGT